MVGHPSRLTHHRRRLKLLPVTEKFLASRSFRCRSLKSRLFERAPAMLFDQSHRRSFSRNISPNPCGVVAAMGGDKTVSR